MTRVRAWALPGALLLCTLWIYRAYASAHLVCGNDDQDALTYHTVVADALAQFDGGTFPPYVGQSAFRWNGGLYPQAQAPGLGLLAVGLHVLTAARLGSVGTLNAVVLVCALGGALSMYAVLRRLGAPAWLCAAGAWIYATCPGVLGVLVRLDMFTTFLTLPLLPLVWLAVVGFWTGATWRQALLLGLALAALWTCHAPVALWTTCLAFPAALAGCALGRTRVRQAALALAMLLLADAWHLTTVFSLGADDVRAAGTRAGLTATLPRPLVDMLMANIHADLPGAFLPVGWAPGGRTNGWPDTSHEAAFLPQSWRARTGTPYLQLGYALWAALGAGCWAAWRWHERRSWPLLAAVFMLLVFLFPWPWLARFAWSHVPAVFGITRVWPMQRFYLLLASLLAPIGVLALAPLRRSVVMPGVALGILWSGYEAHKFSALALAVRATTRDVALPENAALKRKDIQMGAARALPEFSDPVLHLRLVSSQGSVLFDPQALLAERCAAAAWSRVELGSAPLALRTLNLAPGEHLVACLRAPPATRVFAADGRGYLRVAEAVDGAGPTLLPLWSSLPEERRVTLQLTPPPLPAAAGTAEFALTAYDAATFPVQLTSLVPLVARVTSDATGRWLETPRLFVPGYRGVTNGRPTELRSSVDGYTQLALVAGANVVRLEYVGTPAMQAAFWVSAVAWLAGLLALVRGLPRARV